MVPESFECVCALGPIDGGESCDRNFLKSDVSTPTLSLWPPVMFGSNFDLTQVRTCHAGIVTSSVLLPSTYLRGEFGLNKFKRLANRPQRRNRLFLLDVTMPRAQCCNSHRRTYLGRPRGRHDRRRKETSGRAGEVILIVAQYLNSEAPRDV